MRDKATVMAQIYCAFGDNAFVEDQLRVADPVFHLTQGFFDTVVQMPTHGRVFVMRRGESAFINPQRYGAATWYDYARYRRSVFTKEETHAIVAYLEFRRELNHERADYAAIEAALQDFWWEGTQITLLSERVQQHLVGQDAYAATIYAASQEPQRAP